MKRKNLDMASTSNCFEDLLFFSNVYISANPKKNIVINQEE